MGGLGMPAALRLRLSSQTGILRRRSGLIGKGPKRHKDRPNVRAIIGDDVSIGSHAVIAGDVIFGDHVDVGAQVVVTKDIPTDGRVRAPHAIIDAGKS